MKKRTTRILSLFMVFTMMLSLAPPVNAADGEDPPLQPELETAGTLLPEGGNEQPGEAALPTEDSTSDETQSFPDPQPQETGEGSDSVPSVPELPEELHRLLSLRL